MAHGEDCKVIRKNHLGNARTTYVVVKLWSKAVIRA